MGVQVHPGSAPNRAQTGIKKGNARVSAYKTSETVGLSDHRKCQWMNAGEHHAEVPPRLHRRQKGSSLEVEYPISPLG